MHNFSDQCLDLARSLLGNNLQHINEDGSVTPAPGEKSRVDEPGHAALAIGEFFRATGEVELGEYDLHDLTARCVTQQAFNDEANDNGMAYASLGLLSFGASKERNAVWERLLTRPENNWINVFSTAPITKITIKLLISPSQSPVSVSV